jgi:hypothetical protein
MISGDDSVTEVTTVTADELGMLPEGPGLLTEVTADVEPWHGSSMEEVIESGG